MKQWRIPQIWRHKASDLLKKERFFLWLCGNKTDNIMLFMSGEYDVIVVLDMIETDAHCLMVSDESANYSPGSE